jgi:hypothetical protein
MNGSLIVAIRGPVMLITLGVLLALDQTGLVSFARTWPGLLIMYGILKLGEFAAASKSRALEGPLPAAPGGNQSGPGGGVAPGGRL